MSTGPAHTLPALRLGTDGEGKPVTLAAEHRARGTLLMGQPGLGKSNLLVACALQDAAAGAAVLFVDPHDGAAQFLRRLPESRWHDVVILSLTQPGIPIWPVLDMARKPDEVLVVADHLTDAWRALSGDTAIGPRAQSIIQHTLLTAYGDGTEILTPIDLLCTLVASSYQTARLSARTDLMDEGFPLTLFWNEVVASLGPRAWQEWAQSTDNKIAPLVLHPWLRRATSGLPPIMALPAGSVALLDGPDVRRVYWVRDGSLVVTRQAGPTVEVARVPIAQELEPWLLDGMSGGTVRAPAFPQGRAAAHPPRMPDHLDPSLRVPDRDERATYGRPVVDYVGRRRRRRAWARRIEYDLAPRGIEVREAIASGDMLDEGKLVVVEVPESYGSTVTETVGTFVLLEAVLRGIRALALPEARRIPVAIYIDEAELFMNRSFDVALAQLRKAGTALTFSVQRLGQLGVPHAALRRAIVDTVGTIIALGPGLGEVPEVAALVRCTEEQLLGLERGQGVVSTLTPSSGQSSGWARMPTQALSFPRMRPVEHEDVATRLRAASQARYTQREDLAIAGYRQRVARIATVIEERADRAARRRARGDPRADPRPTGAPVTPATVGPAPPEPEPA